MEKKDINSKVMQELITYGGGIPEQKILKWLLNLINILSFGKKNKFNRSLPLADYFVDRWEKAKSLNFGEGTSIYDNVLVLGDVKVGKNCWIGPNVILDGSGDSLSIGDHCDISAGVQIYTHDTVDRVIYNKEIEKGKVMIGNNCYIGPNVVISKDIIIEDFVVIGANSFVNKNIPSYSKAFGTPATVKGKIN
jgi:acetyltransferase-like isoleucine patch superfamily enzyme